MTGERSNEDERASSVLDLLLRLGVADDEAWRYTAPIIQWFNEMSSGLAEAMLPTLHEAIAGAVRVERDALAAERDHWESVAEDNAVVAEDALARAAALQTAIERALALCDHADVFLGSYIHAEHLRSALAAAAVGAVPETREETEKQR